MNLQSFVLSLFAGAAVAAALVMDIHTPTEIREEPYQPIVAQQPISISGTYGQKLRASFMVSHEVVE